MSLNVIFMGTPEFSLPALEKLIKNNFNILTIYTQPPKKSKRGQKLNVSPIEKFSRKRELNLRCPSSLNNDEEFKSSQLYNKNGFKGLHGEFYIEGNLSKQKLKIYKISNKKFVDVY